MPEYRTPVLKLRTGFLISVTYVKIRPFKLRLCHPFRCGLRSTLHKLMELRNVENKSVLLSLCRCSLRRPTKQPGNRRFVLNRRMAHLAPFQNRSQLFPQRSMPKRKRKERDKRSQDRESEQPSDKPSCTTQKALDRESAIQLPMTNRCDQRLLECISDCSLHANLDEPRAGRRQMHYP